MENKFQTRWWFVNRKLHKVTLKNSFNPTEPGMWFKVGELPEKYESWIDNSEKIF